MARVMIKCRGEPDREKKTRLLEILCGSEIHVTKVFSTPDGFALLLLNEDHADNIFSQNVKEALEANDFAPILPPEIKVKKSVIVTRVDEHIYHRDVEAIKEELGKSNNWIGENVDTIFKFPNSNTVKITFTQTALAKKCTQNGFLAFNLSVPPHQIKQETYEYIPIKCCMKCYKLEDHATRECDKPNGFKICSECGQEGHYWHQCKERKKCCINCGEEHSTLAMKCTIRKDILKEKRRREAERNQMTYVGATRNTNSNTNTYPPHQTTQIQHHTVPGINKEDTLKFNICFVHAHYRNIENSRSFEDELNKILTLNNLPKIKIPETPSSAKILSTQLQQPTSTTTTVPETKPRKSKERQPSVSERREE